MKTNTIRTGMVNGVIFILLCVAGAIAQDKTARLAGIVIALDWDENEYTAMVGIPTANEDISVGSTTPGRKLLDFVDYKINATGISVRADARKKRCLVITCEDFTITTLESKIDSPAPDYCF